MENNFLYTETCTNPQRARAAFQAMRAMGADAVTIVVYEQDMLRWKPDMQRVFDIAAEVGLRRYISYGRYGGVFSGALMVPSLFAFLHPETLVMPQGEGQIAGEADAGGNFFTRICCVNNPAFREYMREQTQEMLTRYNPEGLLFDEPKGLDVVCACRHCLDARHDGETGEQANLRFQVEFVRDLCDQAKAHRADSYTMLVVGHTHDAALERFAAIDSLEVLGTEAYWVARGKDIEWMRDWCEPAVQKLASFGKKTQLWASNWGLPEHETENLAEAYAIMAAARPDQLASFWWWRNSANPERVMEITTQSIKASRCAT